MTRHCSRQGFTLVELLVVIAIIGILVGLLLPAVQAAREAARRMSCSNNLKQLGLALHNYEGAFKSFPYGHNANHPSWETHQSKGGYLLKLMPFMEQGNLFNRVDFIGLYGTPGGHPGGGVCVQMANLGYGLRGWGNLTPRTDQRDIPSLRCPSDGFTRLPEVSMSNYAGSMGNQFMPDGGRCPGVNGNNFGTGPAGHGDGMGDRVSGVFSRFYWAAKLADVQDGTSNVIAMGEIRPKCGDHSFYHPWSSWNAIWMATTAPINFATCGGERGGKDDTTGGTEDCNHFRTWNMSMGFKSLHTGGAQFVLCDGSVQFISETIDYMTYQRLGDRRDGNPTGWQP